MVKHLWGHSLRVERSVMNFEVQSYVSFQIINWAQGSYQSIRHADTEDFIIQYIRYNGSRWYTPHFSICPTVAPRPRVPPFKKCVSYL